MTCDLEAIESFTHGRTKAMRENRCNKTIQVGVLVFVFWMLGFIPSAGAGEGDITTIAGGGGIGDGNLATAASLMGPESLFIDGSGNIYIADTRNNRIRKVDASGIITTVAGNGEASAAGDGGLATEAGLRGYDIFVDGSGNIYIADAWNEQIRKVDASGIISTVAGNGETGFSGDGGLATEASLNTPYRVFVDGAGNI